MVSRRWMAAQWILIGLLVLSLVTPPTESLQWARLPGMALGLLGLLLVAVSAYTYAAANRALIRTVPDPDPSARLVDRGIYGYVRHPIYLGAMVGAFGIALFHGGLYSLAVAAAISVFYSLKSRYEESLLRRAFPGYDGYRRRTGRFLPLWSSLTGRPRGRDQE